MQHTNDPDPPQACPVATALLRRTRSAVLNVLVGVGLTIAVGGWLLRGRAEVPRPPPPRGLHDALMLALIALAVASYLVRRLGGRRAAGPDLDHRHASFYRSHVLAAVLAALAAPLGIVYGWFIDPRLPAVIPFWVVPLALGFLAIPRAHELGDFDQRSADPGATPS